MLRTKSVNNVCFTLETSYCDKIYWATASKSSKYTATTHLHYLKDMWISLNTKFLRLQLTSIYKMVSSKKLVTLTSRKKLVEYFRKKMNIRQ